MKKNLKNFFILSVITTLTIMWGVQTIQVANSIWSGGLEAVLGFIALGGIWWAFFMPKYTAICCHDGQQWINVVGKWSATRGVSGNDEEQFTKQWLAQVLTGKFITTEQARLPVNPVPRIHHVTPFGAKRGVYYIIGVRIFDPELLNKFSGRLPHAPVEYEVEDEYLPL
ncbi:MAG: hypothetical protein KBD15_02155 [Candidatus Magasanikbacteria bacterium]|nr:hypothetical protein [Candidatus Magasanikbacteria bacterium]